MVTESEISPQRKLGSLRNLRLFLIRYEVICTIFSFFLVKIRACTRVRSRQFAHARVYGSCARIRARIFTKKNLLITSYLIRKSLKFRKDPSFRWGDISLFVTMYDLDLKFLSFSKTKKNSILSDKKRTLRIIFFNFFFDENGEKSVICQTQKTV